LRGLIITADDFGAALEVNEAIEIAHRRGILTAASLMVSAPDSVDAVRRARMMPLLRVGLHVVLVEGTPTLPSRDVSLLVDKKGAFRSDMVSLGCLLVCSAKARRQLGDEITAQFEAFRATGLVLDHCNAHKHFHLHPVVAELLLRIGRRFGLKAVRVPLEERRLLLAIEPKTRRSFPGLVVPFAALLRRRIRAAGLHTTTRVFGLDWSGQMTKERLLKLIRNLPSGISEIYLHPATGSYAGHAPGYQYREELDALLDPEVIAACRDRFIELGGFGDLVHRAGELTRVTQVAHIGTQSGEGNAN
jgi:hopanoid biosynthesis associated protein HpnK